MNRFVLGIDPGPTHSAVVEWNYVDQVFRTAAKLDNRAARDMLTKSAARDGLPRGAGWAIPFGFTRPVVAVEMVESYGMPVGAEVFATCVEVGRFVEVIEREYGVPPLLVGRKAVKVHHCGSARAKDSNVRQALVDRFAPGAGNHGKGTKAAPTVFYGFTGDVWQAAALAVYVADTHLSVSLDGGVGEV